MSRRTRTHARKSRKGGAVWKKGMPSGTYDFERGVFTPDPSPLEQTVSNTTTDQPAEFTTTVHGVPTADGPVTVSGDMALPGFENLTFAELTVLAGMAGITNSDQAQDEFLEGEVMEAEMAAARQLLADADEREEDPLSLAHAMAYLDSVHKAIGRQLARTRTRAEQTFAAAELITGMKSLGVELDDGGPTVCTIHIQESKPEVLWIRDALLAYCREHSPQNVMKVVAARALEIPEVIAFVETFYPECVRAEVRPAYLTVLAKEINDEGVKADPNGEPHKLANIRPPVRTGAFRLTYAKSKNGHAEGKERVEAQFRKGLLGDVLALGVAPDPEEE